MLPHAVEASPLLRLLRASGKEESWALCRREVVCPTFGFPWKSLKRVRLGRRVQHFGLGSVILTASAQYAGNLQLLVTTHMTRQDVSRFAATYPEHRSPAGHLEGNILKSDAYGPGPLGPKSGADVQPQNPKS